MKTTKLSTGQYLITGNMARALVQYEISYIGGAWAINRVYGSGPEFNMAYRTKGQAVASVKVYMD